MAGAMTSIQRLVVECARGLEALGVAAKGRIDPEALEALAVLIYGSMSGRGRSFHTVDHVFELCHEATPLQTLAALFHDAVYVQVDGGLAPEHQTLLGDAVVGEGGAWRLRGADAPRRDPLREMVLALFAFEPGQIVSPFGGLNEYLSALLAVRSLARHLSWARLAQVAACIEATIPFRDPRQDSLAALAARLSEVDERFGLGLGEEAVRGTVHQACGLANRDVTNFAQVDVARFLDATWMLLPETNVPLRLRRRYTLSDYRRAIETMEGFLTGLDPGRIYRSYEGRPDLDRLEVLRQAAARNLDASSRYMQAKLVASALLESLALRTGGDAPIALFMGDLPGHLPRAPPLRGLPSRPAAGWAGAGCAPRDRAVAREGPQPRRPLRHPLIADQRLFVPRPGRRRYRRGLRASPAAPRPAAVPGLLEALPATVLDVICDACAAMAPTRAARLAALRRQLVLKH